MLQTKSFEIKELNEDGAIEAYLSTFDNVDRGGDVVQKGAFDNFIKEFDPSIKKLPMLLDHKTALVIGEWTDLEVDSIGLKAKGTIYTDVTNGADTYALLKRGAFHSVSIGYVIKEYQHNKSGGLDLFDIELVETSVVLRPMNEEAKVISVKSDDGLIDIKSLKDSLRNAGLNRREIDALFNEGFKGIKNLHASEEFEAVKDDLIEILQAFKL